MTGTEHSRRGTRGCGTCQTSMHLMLLYVLNCTACLAHSYTLNAECALSAYLRPYHAGTSCTQDKTESMDWMTRSCMAHSCVRGL